MTAAQRVQILDGGMGRQLKAMGAPFRQPEWSALALMEAPEAVGLAHRQFIEAGANIITTNNYAVVPFHLGEERFDQQVENLTGLAGQLARQEAEAAVATTSVAGSLPPLFGSYRPEYFEADKAESAYARIVASLAPHIDLWLAETISCLAEFSAIRQSLRDQGADFWVSFTLSDELTDGRARLRSEESIAEMFKEVCSSDGRPVQGILFNCSQPEMITLALSELHELLSSTGTQLLTGGYGNAFTPRGKNAEANSDVADMRDELTPEHYAEFANSWRQLGASVLGGCCGIGPEHIACIKHNLVS
ncbi:MAG: homocysteine S-methyltransferase family protein [Pseudomonadales bacterium]